MLVLVLAEGVNRGALAAIRALAADGHEVHVASPDDSVVGHSRHVSARHSLDQLPDLEADVALAASDATLLLLARTRPAGIARLPFPPDAVERVLDKHALADAAAAVGLPAPRTLPADYEGPAVVKPRAHLHDERVEAVVTDDAQQAASALRARGHEPLIQERLDGPLTALTIVTGPDQPPLGHVAQRALHVWPQPTGVSCRAVTEAADPAQVEAAHRLLASLGWWGLAQLQFLDGRLIDLNPRLYGSLALAVGAGVPVPRLLVDPAAGPVGEGRPGVAYSWLEGDLRRAAAQRRGGLASDLRETAAAARRSVPVLWDSADPMPAVRATADLARRALRKAVRR